MSIPHCPKSIGIIKTATKIMKNILTKCEDSIFSITLMATTLRRTQGKFNKELSITIEGDSIKSYQRDKGKRIQSKEEVLQEEIAKRGQYILSTRKPHTRVTGAIIRKSGLLRSYMVQDEETNNI